MPLPKTDREAQLTLLVSHQDADSAFAGSNNLGSNKNQRDIIADTLLKIAGGFGTGYTAMCVCRELKLIGKNTKNLTKKGRRYLYWSYAQWQNPFSEEQKGGE